MARAWQLPSDEAASPALQAAVGGHAIVARRLARMGMDSPAAQGFLKPERYQPASASDLPDIDIACQRLRQAIQQRERILVWGDFDVDGQTSAALLFACLTRLGGTVRVHLPNRFTEGHGIHAPTLDRYLDAGIDLLLTCDTGVSAHAAVNLATARGVDVVITDHHALPPQLPDALAVVNPRRLPAGHSLRDLPGVGVAYMLIAALDEALAAEQLDLVALGLVADVMPLLADNRYLLQRGLAQLREQPRPGLSAILQRANIQPANLDEGDIGFAIAPRLNALGRVEDANPAIELLTTDDSARARLLAGMLEDANARRRFLSNQVYAAARAQIDAQPHLLDYAALVLHHPEWHSGVIGIVASRLLEEYALPTVLLAAPPDDLARGSARSLAGVDIMAALESTRSLLRSYGGHSMAAGMSLPAHAISDFRRGLSQAVRGLGGAPQAPPLRIDAALQLPELTLDLARDIERLAPFGNGNPALTLLTRSLRLADQRALGRRGDHLQLRVVDENDHQQRVIWWRGAGKPLPGGRFDLAYTLRVSHFRGRAEVQVEWLDWRESESRALDIAAAQPRMQFTDYRYSRDMRADLARAREEYPDAPVWAEGAQIAGAVTRLQLQPSETLIVWTIPASRSLWQAALTTVNPSRLVALAAAPRWGRINGFLARLYGMVKYAVSQQAGVADIERLAAALGARTIGVAAGLRLLQGQGKLRCQFGAGGRVALRLVNAPQDEAQVKKWRERLLLILRETRAYRDYWRRHALGELQAREAPEPAKNRNS